MSTHQRCVQGLRKCGVASGGPTDTATHDARRNYFGSGVNESLIKGMADAIVSTGLRELGFTYIHIDAGALLHERGSSGELQVNRTLFPSGIPALSAWLHERRLLLGMYRACSSLRVGAR